MYAGAAVAVDLFGHATPAGVAWLRCLGAAVVLLAWRRPGRAAWRGRRLVLAIVFGVVTAGMNVLFYEAIARYSERHGGFTPLPRRRPSDSSLRDFSAVGCSGC